MNTGLPMNKLTLQDVLMARARISPYIVRTPLLRHLSLDEFVGTKVFVKHENYQKLGSFKVRGGLNLFSQMNQEELNKGVSTASSGNHGQSIAYGAKIFGAKSIIVVPEGANTGKVRSMLNLGAEVVYHGEHFGIADEYIRGHSIDQGYRYVNAVEEIELYAGVGTYAVEIMEDLPNVDVIIVPIGGGSGACGTCIVAKSINPSIQVIGVQASLAPAAYNSWVSGKLEKAPMESTAEGLATNMGYEPAQSILRELLDDFVLVSDNEMEDAILMYLEHTRNLVEHAGAASLAAALKIKDRIRNKNVVLVVSGGNLSMGNLKVIMEKYS